MNVTLFHRVPSVTRLAGGRLALHRAAVSGALFIVNRAVWCLILVLVDSRQSAVASRQSVVGSRQSQSSVDSQGAE